MLVLLYYEVVVSVGFMSFGGVYKYLVYIYLNVYISIVVFAGCMAFGGDCMYSQRDGPSLVDVLTSDGSNERRNIVWPRLTRLSSYAT